MRVGGRRERGGSDAGGGRGGRSRIGGRGSAWWGEEVSCAGRRPSGICVCRKPRASSKI
jgi:hypothetical protein